MNNLSFLNSRPFATAHDPSNDQDGRLDGDHENAPNLTDTVSTADSDGGDLRPGAAPVIELDAVSTPSGGIAAQVAAVEDSKVATASPQDPLPAAKGGKTVLPSGWSLTGDVESDCAVQYGGTVLGNTTMTTSASVELLPGSDVQGSISGKDIVVRGAFEGELDASGGTVSIKEGAKIKGKVKYTGIRMEGGAHQMELVYVEPTASAAQR